MGKGMREGVREGGSVRTSDGADDDLIVWLRWVICFEIHALLSAQISNLTCRQGLIIKA